MVQLTSTEWQNYLHHEIPITRDQGVEVVRFDDEGVELKAPLATNHNDKGTGFAGSLFSVAVLAGWSQVMWYLARFSIDGQAVVSRSEVRFSRPATGDFTARVEPPGAGDLEEFQRVLTAKGRARLQLTVRVFSGGEEVLTLEGNYAAISV